MGHDILFWHAYPRDREVSALYASTCPIYFERYPFQQTLFRDQAERRLNFEISRVIFAPMNTKVCRSNLSPWTFYNGTRHPLLACVLVVVRFTD